MALRALAVRIALSPQMGPPPTMHAPGSPQTANAVPVEDTREIAALNLPWETLAGKTVLVTGAAGMIPAYAVYTLLALNDSRGLGITVLGLVRDPGKAQAALSIASDRDDFLLIQGDVTAPIELDRPVDIVIHGASPARPSLHSASPVDTIRANVQGAFNLLELCVRDGAHCVLMSSSEIYGQQADNAALVTENSYGAVDILNPRACYTEGKRAAETIAVSYRAQYGVPVTIARFGHIFGPGMALDDGRVQADFAADVLAGRDITLNSDGSALRTYTYVADAVAGMFYALLLGTETAYNIADRDGLISIRDLATAFTEARPHLGLGVKFAQGVDGSAYNPVAGLGLDDSRLRGLGWSPQVGLREGLDRTLAWHEDREANA